MIDKGRPWGRAIDRPSGLDVVGSDAELSERVGRWLTGTEPVTPLTARNGDLARTLGAGRSDSPTVHVVAIDAIRFRTDRGEGWSVAHLVARRRWTSGWRGPVLAIMNAEYIGRWDVARRGHPNDGRVEVVEVDPTMTVRQRAQALRRLPTGTHLPHPAITLRSVDEGRWDFDRPTGLWVDGRLYAEVRWLEIDVLADAFELIIG